VGEGLGSTEIMDRVLSTPHGHRLRRRLCSAQDDNFFKGQNKFRVAVAQGSQMQHQPEVFLKKSIASAANSRNLTLAN